MNETSPKTQARSCPICGKPADARHRPFCSARCRMVDLGRWLKGAYRIPVKEAADGPEGPADEAEK